MAKRRTVVIGLGTVGKAAVLTLADEGVSVIAIDKDPDLIQKIDDLGKPNVEAIHLDSTEEEKLKEHKINTADVVFVAMSDLTESVLTTQNLLDLGVKEIIARAVDDRHAKILKKAGATRVVFPERDTGVRVAHSMVEQGVKDVIELGPDDRLIDISIPERLAGKTLRELELEKRFKVQVLSVYYVVIQKKEDSQETEERAVKELRPLDRVLKAGDIVSIIGTPKNTEAVAKEMSKE